MEPQTVIPERITMTDVLRRSADIFDQVDLDGRSFLVVRYGRPVALLTPVGPESKRPVRRVEPAVFSPPEGPLPDIELDPLQSRLLDEIAAAVPRAWSPNNEKDIARAMVALGRMEIHGLIMLDCGRYRPTQLGARFLRVRATFPG